MCISWEQGSDQVVSGEPLAESMFILREGLDRTNAVLAEMFPGSEGFKALHTADTDEPFFFRLKP